MPPTTTEAFVILCSLPSTKPTRDRKIRVMKYVAHSQRHQSDDSRRTPKKRQMSGWVAARKRRIERKERLKRNHCMKH